MPFTVLAIEGLEQLDAEWRAALAGIARGMSRGVELGVEAGAEQARSQHRYRDRSGGLTGSIRGYLERTATVAGGEAVGVLKAGKAYASFVEEGTAAHEILPRRAGVLSFDVDGQQVFAKRVNHPGTPSMPFMGPALQKAGRVAEAEVEVAIERAAAEMSR